ncbi:nitrogenase iron-molybdenum cofactor biosynthesis protein NifN [Desulfurispirillum indicum]|uniref:nitrogenase iron-molybdenum cofactor biosynthesis protein NifN n=1 Tax=Desulfurispirillum indicum TaxID=936456 RepID=UPI001CFA614B|nr:nitrogenase iron-molybdenum cofactor biosynthesis protein NifN [Desulfurispirillum indicum]UCZ56922.1 nitrogenase iron-molybdenum cofactor biosynthesis protein NifN [Desulfurispirillum indicum]
MSHRNLHVNPLKKSSVFGATLAMLGIDQALALHHGSQGCTAFTKNILTQHFREITPMQTTALCDIATIMGDDVNLHEGLNTIITKAQPRLVGLITTGVSETKGDDVEGGVRRFYEKYPQHAGVPVITINTPDYQGDAQWGYVQAVQALLDQLPIAKQPVNSRQITVLASMALTPGDAEELKEIIADFDLEAIVLPDLGATMGGGVDHYIKVPEGDYPLEKLLQVGASAHTIAIGASMEEVARSLQERFGTPISLLPSLIGVHNSDNFIMALSRISAKPVPQKYSRQRRQLLDAMLDSHFFYNGKSVIIAAESDLALSMADFLHHETGLDIACAIVSHRLPGESDPHYPILTGDLGDLEDLANGCSAIITNSNGILASTRKNIPLLRVGYPIKDRLGEQLKVFIGYRGSRNLVYELGNIFLEQDEEASFHYKNIRGVPA